MTEEAIYRRVAIAAFFGAFSGTIVAMILIWVKIYE